MPSSAEYKPTSNKLYLGGSTRPLELSLTIHSLNRRLKRVGWGLYQTHTCKFRFSIFLKPLPNLSQSLTLMFYFCFHPGWEPRQNLRLISRRNIFSSSSHHYANVKPLLAKRSNGSNTTPFVRGHLRKCHRIKSPIASTTFFSLSGPRFCSWDRIKTSFRWKKPWNKKRRWENLALEKKIKMIF